MDDLTQVAQRLSETRQTLITVSENVTRLAEQQLQTHGLIGELMSQVGTLAGRIAALEGKAQ